MSGLAVEANDVRGALPSAVSVRLFGPFRVARNRSDATIPASRKVRALLAFLLMAPRPVHRAKLCEMFWDVPDDPRGALRWRLTKIRGLLSDPSQERVKTENDWVSIDTSTIEVDALWVAARVEAATSGDDLDLLKRLAAKFEGEFLEGFEADRIPLFEAWLIGERQRFQRVHADVLSRIITLLRGIEEALPYIRKRLDLLPYDLGAHRDLLATLASCGRIAEGEAHLEVATRLFRGKGLSAAALDEAWREYRQLAARELRPESSPLAGRCPGSGRDRGRNGRPHRRSEGGAAAPFHRRTALRQPQRRSRTGVFRRRRHGKPDDGPLANLRLLRHRAQYGLHLQRQAGRCEDDRARVERPIRHGGQRSAKRRKNARQRAADRRGKRAPICGPTGSISRSPICSTCRTKSSHG